MNENESAAPFSFMDAQFDSPQPKLLSDKEFMCLLVIVFELGEKTAAVFSANSLA